MLMVLVAGCATLPKSGPTSADIMAKPEGAGAQNFRIREIDSLVVAELNDAPPASDTLFGGQAGDGYRVAEIAAGDILDIAIYEIGVSLFSGGAPSSSANATGYTTHSEKFSGILVDEDGAISLPYLGRITVAGNSPQTVQTQIERGLAGKSQSPQVMVAIRETSRTVAYIGGAVRKPGRIVLTAARERLFDVLALSGGASDEPYNAVVRISRGPEEQELRLSDLSPSSKLNVHILPGDKIDVLRRPRTFLALGAAARVAQLPFDADRISLAEAVAKFGGPNDNLADPKSIFLFRNVPNADGNEATSIYRLNMMSPASYFMAQNIYLRDKDLIYVSNARANIPAKLISIINQLFSPIVTLRAVTR